MERWSDESKPMNDASKITRSGNTPFPPHHSITSSPPHCALPAPLHGPQFLRAGFEGEGVDEFLDLALHDGVELVKREVDAVVGDAALGEVVGADLGGAVA